MSLNHKHILVITSVYPLAATTERHGSFIHETILHLQHTGARLTVFAPAFKGLAHQTLEGVPVYRFRYCFKQWEDLTHGEGAPIKVSQNPFYLIIAACYILAGSWQLFWHCLRSKPDLLHVNWPFPHGLIALPTSLLLRIPMVFTFHGAELLLARKFKFVGSLLRWLMPLTRGITANSSFTQGLIRQLSPQANISVIPYGLTITAKPPQSHQPEQIPTLLYAGRLIERKGVTYLLAALPHILEQHPVRLRVVGNGILEADLKQQCKALNIENFVDFLGFIPNEALVQEYATCDIFVLPSIVDRKGDTEGLGIVMIEALAHCKPVVASRVGGIVDVIRDQDTGLLVPEKDPIALADAILQLLSDPVQAEQMGKRGLTDVSTRFSWPYIATLWENVFQNALRHSPEQTPIPSGGKKEMREQQ